LIWNGIISGGGGIIAVAISGAFGAVGAVGARAAVAAVHGIGCINTPVEEGVKEEGVGGIAVDIHSDNKVEMIEAGSQMKVWQATDGHEFLSICDPTDGERKCRSAKIHL
jgi:hypothetical protein